MWIAKMMAVAALTLPLSTRADITITDEGQLRSFAAAVNSGTDYAGESVFLTQDIALTSGWTPIGTAANPFKGHFEGWGHTISGLKLTHRQIMDGGTLEFKMK